MKKPFKELSMEELNTVYSNFVYYRDHRWNGVGRMTNIHEFYDKHGLGKPSGVFGQAAPKGGE